MKNPTANKKEASSFDDGVVNDPPTASYTPIGYDSTHKSDRTKTANAAYTEDKLGEEPPSSYNAFVEEKKLTLDEPVCDTIVRLESRRNAISFRSASKSSR